MKGFLEKVETTDFRKPFKRLIVIALIVVIACGALTGFLFRTQLAELHALEKMEEQTAWQTDGQSPMTDYGNGEHNGDREHVDGHEIDVFDSGLVTRPSTGAIITAITSIVLCSLCALAYWLMVAAWLYKASAKAGMNRALWPILGLAFNVLAVFAFLIVRGGMTHCTSCGTWQREGKFCVSCGAMLERACPQCGKICKVTDVFCSDCGTTLQNDKSNEVQE
ncbi:MAG: zinc ribbon domain-containing protein [Oscillospiraceae bacterium]|nr:zinc ribbon domain-containing protein [Oscillospiraceae bacterium]